MTVLTESQNQHVLVLGAGLSTPPLIKHLRANGVFVTLASRTLARAEELKRYSDAEGSAGCKTVVLDVENEEHFKTLPAFVEQADAVISMLPYIHHVKVAKIAIAKKTNFLTTSYVSDEMKKLDADAKDAGIVLFNECGVDPGTDHMSAMRVIDGVRARGGRVTSFSSMCGGVPALSSNNNPFGYKFSWAPRGVLLAARNSAMFLKNGKEVCLPSGTIYDESGVEFIDELDCEMEWFANRNSIPFMDVYGLDNMTSFIRGSYRYQGWCGALRAITALGLLSLDERDFAGVTFADLATESVAAGEGSVQERVATHLNLEVKGKTMSMLEWLGLFSTDQIPVEEANTALDAVCYLMKSKSSFEYGEDEEDMIVMKHKYVAEFPGEGEGQVRTQDISTTLIYADNARKSSAMSTLVSLPVAMATLLVLQGKVEQTGIVRPIYPKIYNPILDQLEALGMKFVDRYSEM